jgi:hypothetical protein
MKHTAAVLDISILDPCHPRHPYGQVLEATDAYVLRYYPPGADAGDARAHVTWHYRNRTARVVYLEVSGDYVGRK